MEEKQSFQTKNRIFCYSGTGNSLAAAKQIGERLGFPVEFITAENTDGKLNIECEFCALIIPSYAYGVPKLVKRFILNSEFKAGYLAVIVTYGSSQRGTAAEAVKLLKKKGQQTNFADGTQSVENYVAIFGHPKPKTQTERIAKQRENIEKICIRLESRETNTIKLFRPLSAFVSFIFRTFKPLFPKFYKIKETCNGCGICRRVCPAGAVSMRQKKRGNVLKTIPRFKALKCDHCQACMQLCPQKAIKFLRIRPSSPRYLHHDVNAAELMKRK